MAKLLLLEKNRPETCARGIGVDRGVNLADNNEQNQDANDGAQDGLEDPGWRVDFLGSCYDPEA